MNTRHAHKLRRGLLAAFALTCAAFACALLFPSQAQAEGTDKPGWWTHCYVEDSSGNKKYYEEIQEGIDYASVVGNPVVLTRNDEYGGNEPAGTIPAGQTITINMNGHWLRNSPGYMFELSENSTLILQSSDPDGKADSEGEQFASGGIYGCNQKNGVHMKEGSHLTLDNVTIKKCTSGHVGGAIYIEEDNCTVDLKNNSNITGNSTLRDGGGILIDGENAHVTLDDSAISGNTAGGEWRRHLHQRQGRRHRPQ